MGCVTWLSSPRDALQPVIPLWESVVTILSLGFIIIGTIVGNVLVIMSVFTYRPLRIVQVSVGTYHLPPDT